MPGLSSDPLTLFPPSTDGVWQRLERLSEALSAADRSSPIPALLATARDGLAADAVFLDPGPGGELQVAGSPELSAEWCRGVLARAVAVTSPSAREALHANPLSGPGPMVSGVAMVCLSRTRGMWLVAVRLAPAEPFESSAVRLLSFVRRMYADHLSQEKAKGDLRTALIGLVHSLSSALDARDTYTSGHSERVARMAVRLGEQMRLPLALRNDLYLAGLLHDVGKIGLADAVLLKPGPLTDAEFAQVKEHPVVGETIVGQVKQLRHLCPGVRWHHERWDGAGYPDRLAGEDVPLIGRVLAVADALDAMTSDRPYRPRMPHAKVESIFRDGAGVQWDARIVDAYFGCASELYAICSRGLGESVSNALNHSTGTQPMTLLYRSVVAETR